MGVIKSNCLNKSCVCLSAYRTVKFSKKKKIKLHIAYSHTCTIRVCRLSLCMHSFLYAFASYLNVLKYDINNSYTFYYV